jgi:hypothetical protein
MKKIIAIVLMFSMVSATQAGVGDSIFESMEARLERVEKLTKETERLRNETRELGEVLEDVYKRARQFAAENKELKVSKFNEELLKYNEKIVDTLKDYASKLLSTLRTKMELNYAYVDVAHLKGSDVKTIAVIYAAGENLRKQISKIDKQFEELKDLTVAEIYNNKRKEIADFWDYTREAFAIFATPAIFATLATFAAPRANATAAATPPTRTASPRPTATPQPTPNENSETKVSFSSKVSNGFHAVKSFISRNGKEFVWGTVMTMTLVAFYFDVKRVEQLGRLGGHGQANA